MSFQTMGFDDFAKALDDMGRIDDYAPELLEAAVPELEKTLKENVQVEANRGYAKGDLEESIKSGKPGKNKKGHYIAVNAKGKDRKGVRNNEKLAYLDYGTSKQEARPVISKAINKAEKKCVERMQERFEEITK